MAKRIRGVRLTREERLEVSLLISRGSSFEEAAAKLTAWAPSSTDPWVTAYSAMGEIDSGVTGGSSVGDASAQAAFDNTATKQEVLFLTVDQRVYFSIVDAPPVLDNQGGVSIAISVPEPGEMGMLLSGSGLLVLLQRIRRRRNGHELAPNL